MSAAGVVAVAVAAAALGVLAGVLISRHYATHTAKRAAGLTVAQLLNYVVQTSRNGVVVLNHWGDVVLHNKRAEALGIVYDNRVDDRAKTAAQRVRETGEPLDLDLSPLAPKGRQPEAVRAEVRLLAEEFTVVDAADESEVVRLEATRRDFVANVSHELKTPVGALALLAEAVIDAADDAEEVRRFSDKIYREATRMGTLVSELIDLSRLQGAERLPDLHTVEVDAVVTEALSRNRLAAESAGISVTVDAPSGLLVDGDRTLLVTALANLLDNAVAYSPEASPVSVSRRLVNGAVEIAVTDRGIGIAPADQQRVFERFYRVDKARSRATGGTGLGLAIVKHVAANHGGEVRLWSRPGVGSTFTLRIPGHRESRSGGNGSQALEVNRPQPDRAKSDGAASDGAASDGAHTERARDGARTEQLPTNTGGVA